MKGIIAVFLLLGSGGSGLSLLGTAGPLEEGGIRVRGKLYLAKGGPPMLESEGRRFTLSSDKDFIVETLRDARIAGSELEVRGRFLQNSRLQVHEFFVVRQGSLYRLVYYCDT